MPPGLKTGSWHLWSTAEDPQGAGRGGRLSQPGSAPAAGAGIPRGKAQLTPQPSMLGGLSSDPGFVALRDLWVILM